MNSKSDEVVDTTKIFVDIVDKSLAKKMIIKGHYSHKWTKCSVALGIYYDDSKVNEFFNINDKKLIGCIIFGDPIGFNVSQSISSLVKQGEVLELTRLWIADGYGKNIESYVISESFKWLKKNKSDIKMLVSYADPSYGHIGRIYQATNWLYIESFQAGNPLISFVDKPYKWVHAKTVHGLYGTNVPQKLADIKNQPIWTRKISKKYKYLYILTDRIERKKILCSLKYQPKPYPKENNYVEPDIKVFYPKRKEYLLDTLSNVLYAYTIKSKIYSESSSKKRFQKKIDRKPKP